jgi:hypothetical protein
LGENFKHRKELIMRKIITVLMAIAALITVKKAIAISKNKLITNDGNVWEVYDELEIGREYNLIFDTNGNNNIYDDIILKIV